MGEKMIIIRKMKEYITLTIATLIMIIGIYFFKFPNNFSFGGVTGISIVLSATFSLSASTYNLIINSVLLIFGFIFLGRSFGAKTVYVSTLLSVGLSIMEKIYPLNSPLTDEPLLELIFAVAIPAVSSAIMFNLGASSGGTDIIAMILKKFSTIEIGTALICVDLFVSISAFFIFDVKTGLFSICGLFTKTLLIDGAIENINLCKYFTIICKEPDAICDFIHNTLHRTATQFAAEGTYSKKNEYVILTVLRRSEAVHLRNYIRTKEPGAFMMITNSSEIIGKGFRSVI